jgi:hypothetical protein
MPGLDEDRPLDGCQSERHDQPQLCVHDDRFELDRVQALQELLDELRRVVQGKAQLVLAD